jgi:spore coat polysaccharide biosynthesis protein SpsF
MRGTAIVLQARMGSTRLPGKALRRIGDRTLIEHAVCRLQASGYPVVLATTRKAEDDRLAFAATALGAHVFRGAEDDVLDRFAQAVRHFELHRVVRATGDNPAVDIEAVGRTLALLDRTSASHVVEHGLPYGAAVEAIRASALLDAASAATEPYDREHVTPYLKRTSRYRAVQALAPGHLRRPDLRLTVDTEADLAFMQCLVEAVGPRERPVPLSELIAAADRLSGGATESDRLRSDTR